MTASPAPRRRRRAGEENPMIACACGCGDTLLAYDLYGRPHRFISSHNNKGRALALDAIESAIGAGHTSARAIATAISSPLRSVRWGLYLLQKSNRVSRARWGSWKLGVSDPSNAIEKEEPLGSACPENGSSSADARLDGAAAAPPVGGGGAPETGKATSSPKSRGKNTKRTTRRPRRHGAPASTARKPRHPDDVTGDK